VYATYMGNASGRVAGHDAREPRTRLRLQISRRSARSCAPIGFNQRFFTCLAGVYSGFFPGKAQPSPRPPQKQPVGELKEPAIRVTRESGYPDRHSSPVRRRVVRLLLPYQIPTAIRAWQHHGTPAQLAAAVRATLAARLRLRHCRRRAHRETMRHLDATLHLLNGHSETRREETVVAHFHEPGWQYVPPPLPPISPSSI
jgi:hypothetical protein